MGAKAEAKGGDPPHARGQTQSDDTNSQSSIEDAKMEQKLIWKIDLHILPFVVLLYLFSFLDRGAFGFDLGAGPILLGRWMTAD